jgi:hypothetical protein
VKGHSGKTTNLIRLHNTGAYAGENPEVIQLNTSKMAVPFFLNSVTQRAFSSASRHYPPQAGSPDLLLMPPGNQIFILQM